MQYDTAAAIYTDLTVPSTSLLGLVLLLLVTLPLAAVAGFYTGKSRRATVLQQGKEIDMVVGETTLGAIMALLGLLLAFTFGNALTISQARKATLTEEAAALGTAFLRADYLAEPGRTELQKALLTYAETRVIADRAHRPEGFTPQEFLEETLSAQAVLWPLTLEATGGDTPPAIQSMVASAMNDALDAHLYRMQTSTLPISTYTHLMLLAAALMALFLLGNRAGMLGRQLTWRTFVLSGFLFFVMTTILDTQRGGEGLIRIDDTALKATIFDMRTALEGRT
ncbi:MAG: hypothetical protein AAGB05_08180 [Pseudomonadota bacterium]